MVWSIYKDSSINVDAWEPCYTAWFTDYDMDTNHAPLRVKFLHAGEHDVWYDGNKTTIAVDKNGLWESNAEKLILKMTHKTYHGDFVEGFYKRDGKIHVSIGS